MSISPAQLVMVVATADGAAETARAREAPPRPAAQVREHAAGAAAAAQAEASGPKLSTAMRIDDQRRVYYEVINNRTDDVVLEIPPEQMRKLAEGLAESLKKQPDGHNVDVKS
ncbi:MAG: flagellar protein FlaG [Terriglobia bacterium]|jgi:hypothetical protein